MDGQQPKRVFISYSHEDKRWLDKLMKFLQGAKFDPWSDEQRIKAGDLWKSKIEDTLESSAAALLLVSQDFLNSPFIQEAELTPILKAASDRGMRILWVAVKTSRWEDSAIAEYQCVNDPKRPLHALSGVRLDKALKEIADKINDSTYEELLLKPSAPRNLTPPSGGPNLRIKNERWRQTLEICDYIQKNRPKRIDILQLSLTALWSLDFWATFTECRDVKVRILLMQPDLAARYALRQWHRQAVLRVADQIRQIEIENSKNPNRPTVGIWYYNHDPSVAAIIVDEDVIQLGWYFVHSDPDHAPLLHVSGHDSPGLLAFGSEAKLLLPKVRAHFDSVLAGIRDEPLLFGPQRTELADEWRDLQQRRSPSGPADRDPV